MVNANPNVPNAPVGNINVSNVGNVNAPNVGGQLTPELQKILDSLTPRQRRRYDNSNQNVELLEMIRDERQKSEISWEIVSVAIYIIITVAITLANALYFKSDKSTKNFSLIINSVYYGTKFDIMGIKVEIDGTIYNKNFAFIISIPIMLGLLIAVILGVYVQSPVITVNFVNVGLEVSRGYHQIGCSLV
ncbi:11907_t:CDS:2 [Funneliformis mosseae]|uniref:11907_t:CDS:1 n=1 Tax=Funneliformis mosseae TaxID=27381 RepID=A0A9N8V2R8_FUNMO|nr:11907_t:CDS:2 [Funneliformis mosseae]